jgi:putative membrane protein
MTEPRPEPFVLRAEDLQPASQTPLDAPPPPDADPPTGAAMQTVTRIAARRRGLGLLWPVVGSLLALVISVATYDYLLGLVERYRPLGVAAVALTVLLAVLLVIHLVRELWAFRRLARIDSFRAEATAAHATADREAALALSERLGRFYAARPELDWPRRILDEQRADILDADAILELTERQLLAPLDAAARLEIEAAARTVATTTALVPLALMDVMTALWRNVRMIRTLAEIYGAHAGFFGSWRVLRLVAAHLLATGLVAVGDDMLGSVAGGHLLARISRRFGEGAMNGALTARVGLAALDVCRPLPFTALARPSTASITSRALAGLFQKAET